jgi:hypothetical protein
MRDMRDDSRDSGGRVGTDVCASIGSGVRSEDSVEGVLTALNDAGGNDDGVEVNGEELRERGVGDL